MMATGVCAFGASASTHWRAEPQPASAPARVALLGTGHVGKAVLARMASWGGTPLASRLSLVHVANSRAALSDERGLQLAASQWQQALVDSNTTVVGTRTRHFDDAGLALCGAATRIVIDATPSEEIAARHAEWLARGIHVVTACKLARGGTLQRWQSIEAACALGDAQYGDAATVGAGLPILRTLRELRAGGDRIHAIAGVLSGSLAWLFNRFDGVRPFSELVREARRAGYTEPDARDDLSGADVSRKLLILARASGVLIERDSVEVRSLVPRALAWREVRAVDSALELLDAPMLALFKAAQAKGEVLRFVAHLGRGSARVGIESLRLSHPLASGAATDNRVAIWTDRYRDSPLVIQGPGAGADVTAAALLDDALRIARRNLSARQ